MSGKYNKKSAERIELIMIMLAIILFITFISESTNVLGKMEAIIKNGLNSDLELNSRVNGDGLRLNSKNVLLISLDDDEILINRKGEDRIYPASLTKIMSTIIAMESLESSEYIYLDNNIFHELYEKSASLAGFSPGDSVKAKDLYYASILPSGGEAMLALAKKTAGDEEKFVRLMNKKAKELDMNDTNFVNSTGLHNDNHYTSLNDMSKLIKYSLKNPEFRQVFITKEYISEGVISNLDGIYMKSTLYTEKDNLEFPGGRILGGKTGFTYEAGLCLASIAEKNGRQYLLITSNADGESYIEQDHIDDAINIYSNIIEDI